MRKPALLKKPAGARTKVSSQTSVPAPVGGWNARDSIANMDPADAILLDNWFPTPSDVMLRKGYTRHSTGISGQVQSLMPYNRPNGTQTLFGAAGTAFYNVTSSGAVGAAVQSSLTNAKWYSTIFTTTAATYLIACNGADKPRYWDGSAWVAVDAASTPAITGVTTTGLIYPFVHKNRVFFIEKDTLTIWYLPTDAVGGAATAFRLNGVAKKGGYAVAGGTWTIDGGEGVDDHWVVVTSEGEAIVYKGTDISSATTWTLVGVYNIGEPIGRRCPMKWGGDLLVITKEGVLPLSQALITDKTKRVAFTDKITDAMADAASQYASNFGWDLTHYPNGAMLILNVPTADGSDQHQYVMNTITGAWCRFKDIEANCWAILNGEPYFGGDGFVGKLWGVFADNSTNINGDLKQAFNYFRARGVMKDFKAVRPIFASNGSPSVLATLNMDYEDNEASAALTFSPTTYAVWDSAVWDTGVWGGGLSPIKNWQTVGGTGTCAALRLKTAANGLEVRFQVADYLYEAGSVIG